MLKLAEFANRFIGEGDAAADERPFFEGRRSNSKTGVTKLPDQFPALALNCSEPNSDRPRGDIDVVVIALEPHPAATQLGRERMKLVEVGVRYEMTPERVSPRPSSRINEDGHRFTLAVHKPHKPP